MVGAARSQPVGGLRAGMVVADRYRVLERIGEGAVGTVWRATHVELGTQVAVKVIHISPDGKLEAEEIRARFAREARLAARLAHSSQYIARVTDYGVDDTAGPFLVMELLSGETLADRLRREGRLPLLLVARLVSELARALEVAHAAGVIHRDIKPANVFLSRSHDSGDVHVKLMDFGIAKLVDEDPTSHRELATRRGAIVGTPAYMSPEQALAQSVDARSDLFSLGSTVYRLLTGQLPFGTANMPEVGFRIVGKEPAPPSTHAPELPPAVDRWMRQALAKVPAERFADAREMADALLVAAGVDPHARISTSPHPSPTPSSGVRLKQAVADAEDTRRHPALERTSSGLRRKRRWRAVHLVLVALAVLIGAFVLRGLLR